MSKENWTELWKHFDENLMDWRIEKTYKSNKWADISKMVIGKFGGFKKVKVIELGAGTGTFSLCMAQKGAFVTILDYSEDALDLSKKIFKKYNASADFVNANALNLLGKLLSEFDISMSFGLAEHFDGNERIEIIKAHYSVLRPGGMAVISVPNRYNPAYRLWKFILQTTKRWTIGYENPYSFVELKRICEELGIKKYFFISDSFLSSLNYFSPNRLIARLFHRQYPNIRKQPKKEIPTILDEYCGAALIVVLEK